MPVIDYECKKCGKKFFEIVKNADDKVCCPECGSFENARIYKGKYYGKNSGGCTGHCATCSGCGH